MVLAAADSVGLIGFWTAIATAVLGIVGNVAVALVGRKANREARDAAVKAEGNTRNVSNGFAGNVLGRLESIDGKVDSLTESFTDHLKWHLAKDK